MAVNDVYEIRDHQEYRGQKLLNVYFYEQKLTFIPGGGANEAQVALEEFRDDVVPVIAAFQNASLVHTLLECRNLFNSTDFWSEAISVPGADSDTNDAMAVFNAASFVFPSSNKAIRPGGKRIAGAEEYDAVDGVFTGSVTLGELDDIAEILEQPLYTGSIIRDPTFYPCIVKRVKTIEDGVAVYRLPETVGQKVTSIITSALYSALVSSQVSRKIGRGE